MYSFYQTYLHFENDLMFFYENLTEFNNEIDRNEICKIFVAFDFLELFGIFWYLLESFGWPKNRAVRVLLESFGILWNLLESFGIFWNLLESFGIFWNPLVGQGLEQLDSIWNLLESFGRPRTGTVKIILEYF